jgi:hypothetical protein
MFSNMHYSATGSKSLLAVGLFEPILKAKAVSGDG